MPNDGEKMTELEQLKTIALDDVSGGNWYKARIYRAPYT